MFESKNIYLRKGNEIIGLHAIGYSGPYEYELHNLDGTIELIQTDFVEIEKWGNFYDKDYNILGRGSFRIHDISIDTLKNELLEDGWEMFEREIE